MFSAILNYLFAKPKNRPYCSTILYFLSGAGMALALIDQILPVHIPIPWEDSFSMDDFLTDGSLYILITLGVLILYLAALGVSRIAYNPKLPKHSIVFHSFADMLDLLLSILSSLFILSSIVQFYTTGAFYGTIIAWILYTFVAIRFLTFLFYQYETQNRRIYERVLMDLRDTTPK